MIHRLITCGLVVALLFTVLLFVHLAAFSAKGADFEKDWLYEDLTCEEIASGYNYSVVTLTDILVAHNNCTAYADSPADTGFGELHCALLKQEGLFVQGQITALVGVFNIKCGNK